MVTNQQETCLKRGFFISADLKVTDGAAKDLGSCDYFRIAAQRIASPYNGAAGLGAHRAKGSGYGIIHFSGKVILV